MVACDAPVDTDSVNLIYATTRGEHQVAEGAEYTLCDPTRVPHIGGPFSERTYVLYSRLTFVEPEDIDSYCGVCAIPEEECKTKLRRALGIGSGTATADGPAHNSLRGAVARVMGPVTEFLGTERAVILTEPEYSKKGSFQLLLPVYSGDELEANPGDIRIPVGEDPHLSAHWRMRQALFAVPWICYGLYGHDLEVVEVDGENIVMDEEVMGDLDAAIVRHFDLF